MNVGRAVGDGTFWVVGPVCQVKCHIENVVEYFVFRFERNSILMTVNVCPVLRLNVVGEFVYSVYVD